MHGDPFGGARFVNDALEKAADRGVRKRAAVVARGVGQNLVFTRRLVNRHAGSLFQASHFESALRTLIQKLNDFFVNLIHALPPVGDVHGVASRRDNPRRPASFNTLTRSRSAAEAASIDEAFSISETSAEPTTAASARPPSTETWPGSEMPKPTATGNCVTARA